MTTFILSLIGIGGYLVSPALGFVAMIFVGGFIFLRGRTVFLEKILTFLIISIPLYMTPVISGLPPFFSWTTLGLLVVSVYLFNYRAPISVVSAYVFLLFGLATLIMVFNSPAPQSEVYYAAQLILFVVPALIVFAARDKAATLFAPGASRRLLISLAAAIGALGVGVLAQWQIHLLTGLELGQISYFRSRTSYDLLIPAYSVLSGILALGLPLGPILWRRSAKTLGLVLPILSSIAILINSSRTGLIAGAVTLLLILLFPPNYISRTASRLAVIPVIGLLGLAYAAMINSPRFVGRDFLDDHGRFETFRAGWNAVTSGPMYLFFGYGYAAYPETVPHNFIVETFVSSGLMVLIIFLGWLTRFGVYLKGSSWFFLPFSLLAGSMFYSGFYAVKAFTIVLVVAILCKALDDKVAPLDSEARTGGETSPGVKKKRPDLAQVSVEVPQPLSRSMSAGTSVGNGEAAWIG